MINSFIEYLIQEKNYSPLTVKAYEGDIREFQKFNAAQFEQESINEVTYTQIRTWIVNLSEQKISNRSINRKVSSLRAYYRFLLKLELISENPLAKHKALKVSKKQQLPFSKSEMDELFKLFSVENSFVGLRNQLIIELFYATGIRRIELVNLKLSDINLDNKTLKVLGKRNKERILPLIGSIQSEFKLYLAKRKEVEKAESESYLFLTEKGAKIYETLVYRVINEYFSKVSSKVKRSPHMIRHTFATHLLNQGANLNAVKELLGHSSLAATQVYTHNSINELKKVYSKTHPRSKNM
ncbi:MAG: integrase [Bacteroidetes bacterium MedPE-SWsnd-G2]|nr:MAG: integrase [Bacteroidetes bacterium MedPE-SWsnd-G2]